MLAIAPTCALRPAAGFAARPSTRSSRAARCVVVRASTEGETPAPAPEAAPQVVEAIPPPAPAPSAPGFADVMAFNGAAPETVNGRLAQLGFLSALGAELATGKSVGEQWATGAAADWIVFSALLFVGASLIPIFKGVKNEAFGPFTPDAEKLNGRAAMIGLAALLGIEALKGSALF